MIFTTTLVKHKIKQVFGYVLKKYVAPLVAKRSWGILNSVGSVMSTVLSLEHTGGFCFDIERDISEADRHTIY